MLRKGSSIMRIPSQLISNSWLISVLVHIALIIALREAYPAKTNHTNDEFKTVEFVIYQPEPDKLPQKEIPKDIAKAVSKAASKVKSISVSKQSVVSKPDIISEVKIVSQSKSIIRTRGSFIRNFKKQAKDQSQSQSQNQRQIPQSLQKRHCRQETQTRRQL